MAKKQQIKRDMGKIATRVIAAILAILMIIAGAASLIFNLLAM